MSGSPMPSEITSTPAAFFSAIFCSSSREQVGRDALQAFGRPHRRALQLGHELVRELAAEDGLGPPGERHVEIGADLDLELAAVQLDGHRAARLRRSTAATAAPDAPVPEASVSPTPRSKIRARTRPSPSTRKNDTLVRFGNSSLCSIGGPIVARSSSSRPSSTRIAHCGLPMLTCWNSNSRPSDDHRAAAVLAPGREVRRAQAARGPSRPARARRT